MVDVFPPHVDDRAELERLRAENADLRRQLEEYAVEPARHALDLQPFDSQKAESYRRDVVAELVHCFPCSDEFAGRRDAPRKTEAAS